MQKHFQKQMPACTDNNLAPQSCDTPCSLCSLHGRTGRA